MPLQLSWQSRGLKIPVSLVRFRPEAPQNADLAHLVERRLAKAKVAGSSPVIRSIIKKEEMQISSFLFGSIAQLGEHLPYKQRVIGSSPIVSTIAQAKEHLGKAQILARQFSWLERQPVTLEVRGSSPLRVATFADLAHLVERDLAKVEVAGSSPVIRSNFYGDVAKW